ncbi:MAG: glycosyltransferase family 1 protein [Cyanobacteria bacterium J06600_6]
MIHKQYLNSAPTLVRSPLRVAIVRRQKNIALSMDVYADNLINELKQIRPEWEIMEIAPEPWGDDPENLWHSGNPLKKYYERFWRHPRRVKRQMADIFHIIDHTDGHVAYWLQKLGKPVVMTCHDLVQYVYPEILRNQSRFPALSMAVWKYSVRGLNSVDRIVTVSQNTAEDITRWLKIPSQQVETVANGVESNFRSLPDNLVAKWRSQYSQSGEICLLNVGSTHQRKNIETILQVVATLVARGIAVRLWKLGSDFTPQQQQQIRDLQIESSVSFLGQQNQDALVHFYNAADVLLAPSLYEGFGLTVLEAMACGTPTIAANASSLPEVVGDAGILVEPLDVKAIADAIVRLQQDSDFRQTIVQKGLVRVRQFTWKQAAVDLAAVYESLALS